MARKMGRWLCLGHAFFQGLSRGEWPVALADPRQNRAAWIFCRRPPEMDFAQEFETSEMLEAVRIQHPREAEACADEPIPVRVSQWPPPLIGSRDVSPVELKLLEPAAYVTDAMENVHQLLSTLCV
jgi:hypothetical protein